MPTGDFPDYRHYPADYPSSFTVASTAPLLGVCSTAAHHGGSATWTPSGVTTGTVTVAPNTNIPNTGIGVATTHTYPYVNTPNHGGLVWASTGTMFNVEPEWTHRIWFNEHWTYYMQTSNEAEDILMNKRKIKQSCLLR